MGCSSCGASRGGRACSPPFGGLRDALRDTRRKRSAADAFRELDRWEGETGAELDALFAPAQQLLLCPARASLGSGLLKPGEAADTRADVIRAGAHTDAQLPLRAIGTRSNPGKFSFTEELA